MDKKIIDLIKNKNEKGIEILINQYGGLIKCIVKKNLSDLELYHDDCINEVYLGVWKNINNFDEERNTLKNWVAVIAKYKSVDYKRKYIKTREEIDIYELPLESNSNVEYEVLKDEIEEETKELLNVLSPIDRDIFTKLFLEESSINDVSKQLGMKPANIYNRISRGKKKIKELFFSV